ncbi:MAG: hypothetical protein ACOYXT_13865 [Bacteroidota bacterium]
MTIKTYIGRRISVLYPLLVNASALIFPENSLQYQDKNYSSDAHYEQNFGRDLIDGVHLFNLFSSSFGIKKINTVDPGCAYDAHDLLGQ